MRNAKLLLLTAILASVPGFAQMDPSGEWAPLFQEDFLERIPGPDIGDYLGLPINCAAIAGTRLSSHCPRINAGRIRPITPGAGPRTCASGKRWTGTRRS